MYESVASSSGESQQSFRQPMQQSNTKTSLDNGFSPLSGSPKDKSDNEIGTTSLLSGAPKKTPEFNPLDPNGTGETMPDGTPMPSKDDNKSQPIDTGNLDKLIDDFPQNIDPSNMSKEEKDTLIKKLLDFIKKFLETIIPGLKFGEGQGSGMQMGLNGADGKPISATEAVKMIPDVLKAARLINKIKDPSKEVPDKVVDDLAALMDKYKDLRPTLNGKEMKPEEFMKSMSYLGNKYLEANPGSPGTKEIEHFTKVGEKVMARAEEMKREREAKKVQSQDVTSSKSLDKTLNEKEKTAEPESRSDYSSMQQQESSPRKEMPTKDAQAMREAKADNFPQMNTNDISNHKPQMPQTPQPHQTQTQQTQPQQTQPQQYQADLSAKYRSDVNSQLNDIIKAQREQQSKSQQYNVSSPSQSQGYAQQYMQNKNKESTGMSR